jgi:putative hydrolase of the HAD superfamily
MSLEVIIFDLDNTLYHSDSGLSNEIGRRIRVWLQRSLQISSDTAAQMQHDYYRRYGTTMGGLIVEHQGLDIHDYLEYVHDIPIDAYLDPDPRLETMLVSLGLRKVVYTNATSEYGWRVLSALGVDHCFERMVGIEEVNLRNKVYRDAYECMLRLIAARSNDCIMVEDWISNLRVAKELGMTTILVGTEGAAHVDYVVTSVLDVEQIVRGILLSETAVRGGA